VRHDSKTRRKVERAERKARDPWFGRRRKTNMEGNKRAKASKDACRKGGY
jgi:hypothetical protein